MKPDTVVACLNLIGRPVESALPAWQGQARRFVCLRQTLTERPDARGRRLIECPGYTDRVFVTSVPYAAELVTRMYAGRADSENRIKELKEDLSLDTVCLRSFEATEAAFRTGCVLYNLLMGLREIVLPSCWVERRLRAIRDLVFLVGADLIPEARRWRVRFAVPPEERTEFLQRLRTLSERVPIAAQLDWDLSRPTTRHTPHRLPYPPSGRYSRRSELHPNRISTAESGIMQRPVIATTSTVVFRIVHAVSYVLIGNLFEFPLSI